jgi:hypothetical protein
MAAGTNTTNVVVIASFLRDQDALGRRIDILDVLETARLWLPLLDQRDDILPEFVRLLADELDSHGLEAFQPDCAGRKDSSTLFDRMIHTLGTFRSA